MSTLADDTKAFLDYCENARSMTIQTLRAYRSDLKAFLQFLAVKDIQAAFEVTPALIVEYKAVMSASQGGRTKTPGLANATIARRLAAVSSFYDYLRSKGDGKLINPVNCISLRTKRNNKPKPIENKRLQILLLGVESKRDSLIFQLFLKTGLRVSELVQLNRDTIEVFRQSSPQGTSIVLGRGLVVGKGGKERTFYVPLDVLKLLLAYKGSRTDDDPALFLSVRGTRMSVRAIQERLDHWCKHTGVDHARVHQFRHTFATRMLRADMDILHLRELMGHSSIATTMQYAELADETVACGYHAAMELSNH